MPRRHDLDQLERIFTDWHCSCIDNSVCKDAMIAILARCRALEAELDAGPRPDEVLAHRARELHQKLQEGVSLMTRWECEAYRLLNEKD